MNCSYDLSWATLKQLFRWKQYCAIVTYNYFLLTLLEISGIHHCCTLLCEQAITNPHRSANPICFKALAQSQLYQISTPTPKSLVTVMSRPTGRTIKQGISRYHFLQNLLPFGFSSEFFPQIIFVCSFSEEFIS